MRSGYVEFGTLRLPVDIMESPAERERGLRGRPGIPSTRGMLFDFGQHVRPVMTMRGVGFPIDIVFITPSGYAGELIEYAAPDADGPYSGPLSRWVLELAPGVFRAAGGDRWSPVRVMEAR